MSYLIAECDQDRNPIYYWDAEAEIWNGEIGEATKFESWDAAWEDMKAITRKHGNREYRVMSEESTPEHMAKMEADLAKLEEADKRAAR